MRKHGNGEFRYGQAGNEAAMDVFVMQFERSTARHIVGNAAPRQTETAKAERRTMLLVMSWEHLDRSRESVRDMLILSIDTNLLKPT